MKIRLLTLLFCLFLTKNVLAHGGIGAVGDYYQAMILLFCIFVLFVLLFFLCSAVLNTAPFRMVSLLWIIPTALTFIIGLIFFHLFEPNILSLVLGIELILVGWGLIYYFWWTSRDRMIATGFALLGIVVTNLAYPRLIDFHNREYVNNYSQLNVQVLSQPSYWRVLEFQEGRRLFITDVYSRDPSGQMGSTWRWPNHIRSPVILEDLAFGEQSENYAVHAIETMPGPDGWNKRAKTYLSFPILGKKVIPRFKMGEKLATALLLQEDTALDSKYLYEVLSLSVDESTRKGHEIWIKELIDRSSNPNYVDSVTGRSVLQQAIRAGYIEPVRWLIEAGANVNLPDKYGATALASAVHRHHEVVNILLEHGADITIKDKDGWDPLRRAKRLLGSYKIRAADGTWRPNTESPYYRNTAEIIRLLEQEKNP